MPFYDLRQTFEKHESWALSVNGLKNMKKITAMQYFEESPGPHKRPIKVKIGHNAISWSGSNFWEAWKLGIERKKPMQCKFWKIWRTPQRFFRCPIKVKSWAQCHFMIWVKLLRSMKVGLEHNGLKKRPMQCNNLKNLADPTKILQPPHKG